MKRLALTLCLGLLLPGDLGLASDGPTYQRNRSYGNRGHHGGHGNYGQPFYGYGGYGGFFYPPVVAGSYYQRPYPTHFDYFRLRQRTPLVPPATCPHCGASGTQVEVVQD